MTGHLPEVLPAPEPVGQRVAPVDGPPADLPSGAGLVPRSFVASVLALLGVFGVPMALLVLVTRAAGGDPDQRTAWLLVFGLLWVLLATGLWLASIRTPRRWPWLATLSAFPVAAVVLFAPAKLSGGFAFGVVLVALVATTAARGVWTRRLGTDLAESRVEIPVRLDANGSGRILLGADRIVLSRRGGRAGGHVRHALASGELTLVEAGAFGGDEPGWWPLPGGEGVRLRRGPVLRLVAGDQQWVLPVARPRLLARIIRGRSRMARPPRLGPSNVDEWRELRSWAVKRTTFVRYGQARHGFPAFRIAAAVPLAMFGTLMIATAVGRGLTDPGLWWVSVIALLLAAVCTADWFRVRSRLHLAEEHALPPGSPPWGEQRAGHAPMAHWRPWS